MPADLTSVQIYRACLAGFVAGLLMIAGCGGGGSDAGGGSETTTVTAVDNTPRFAYTINSSVIGSHVVDPESGNLIPRGNSQRFFETAPTDLAARPDGRFLYFSDAGDLAIKRRKIDPQTGVHSPEGADFPTGTGAQQIAMHPSGEFLFYRKSGSNPVTTLALDPATGDMSLVGETAPLSTSGMHLAPDGEFLYTTSDVGTKEIQTFRVEGNGSLAIVDADPVAPGEQPQAFANVAEPGINPASGDVYLVNLAGSVDRYAPNSSNGLLAFVDSTPLPSGTPSSFSAMRVEPLGRFGYSRLNGNLIAGFSIDPASGTLTPIDFDPGTAGIQHLDFGALANSISSLDFEPSGHFAYFGFTGGVATLEMYAIDQTTGALSQATSKPELNQVLGLPGADGIVFTNRTNVPAPQPTFAYSQQSGQIGIHRVDPATGMLTDVGTFATPAYSRLHVDPAQQFMYLGEAGAYARVRIDPETGALSDRETRANAAPNNADDQGLRFDPHNRFAVQTKLTGRGMDLMEVVTGPPAGLGPSKTDVQFTEDPYTVVGTVGASSVRPNSRHLYSTGLVAGTNPNFVRVLRVFNLVATPVSFDRVDANPATAGHQDFPLSDPARDTVVEPLGRYLLNLEVSGGASTDNLAVYELDWADGLPTIRNALTVPLVIRNHTTGSNPLHIALEPRGRFVYVPTDDGIAAFSFTRNLAGPALAAIDDPATPGTGNLFQTLGGNGRLALDPTGQWLYARGSGGTEAFRIDQEKGALSSAGIASPQNIVQVIGRL
jgi:6-phosphogluconolactonase (cycloisomerase 2 family)